LSLPKVSNRQLFVHGDAACRASKADEKFLLRYFDLMVLRFYNSCYHNQYAFGKENLGRQEKFPLRIQGRDGLTKRICVIDGQGGGIGATVIKYLKEAYGESFEMIALGTNAIATAQMIKAGANRGASGENAICRTALEADCIIGPIAITWANAMLGEVTPRMAEAVTSSPVVKILLPLSQERVEIVGVNQEPLPHLIQELVFEKMKEVFHNV
jgi:hypothetical protein